MRVALFQWVIAAHSPTSEQGKYVLGLANQGIGYHVLNKDRMKNDNIIVGFKYAKNAALPQYLQYASAIQSQKLDELDARRRSP